MIKKWIFLNILAGSLLFSCLNLFTMEPEQPITLAELTGEPHEKIMQYIVKNCASEWIRNNPDSAKNLVHALCKSFGPKLARQIASEVAKQAVIVTNTVNGTVGITIAPNDKTHYQFDSIEITMTPGQRYLMQLPPELESNWQKGFYIKISARVMDTKESISGESVSLMVNAKSRIDVKRGSDRLYIITRRGLPISSVHKIDLFETVCCPPYSTPDYHPCCGFFLKWEENHVPPFL
jgi:hypothetical protein